VIFIVYRTRQMGRPIAPQAVLARPERGLVHFAQGPRDLYGRGVMLARLLDLVDRKTELVPSIEHARIERIHEYVHIRGIEHFRKSAKSRVERWDQTWICCTSEEQCRGLMERAHARLRAGNRLDWADVRPMPSPLAIVRNAERTLEAQKAFDAEFDAADDFDSFP
jgi:hypothetical protein